MAPSRFTRFAPRSNRDVGDIDRVEAPVTFRAYLLCVFAAFGGILFGYDSGYINGVLAMNFFKQEFGHRVPPGNPDAYNDHLYSTWEKVGSPPF